MRLHLAKLLVREGLVDVGQIRDAIENERETGQGFEESLVSLGFISEAELVAFLGGQYGVPVMDIAARSIEPEAIGLIPFETASEKCLIPVSLVGADLIVALSDPSNLLLLDDLGFITGKHIIPAIASERSIKNKIAEYYPGSQPGQGLAGEDFTGDPVINIKPAHAVKNAGKLRPIDEIVRELEAYGNELQKPSEEPHAEGLSDVAGPAYQEPAPDADAAGIDEKSNGGEFSILDSIEDQTEIDYAPRTHDENPSGRAASSTDITGDNGRGLYADPERILNDNTKTEEAEPAGSQVTGSNETKRAASGTGGAKGAVLIVDRSPTVRKIVAIALERHGYNVHSAINGMQALAKLNDVTPGLILIDINIPHMDGYQLCKVIRSHGLTKDIPVVMMSGKVGMMDKMKGKMAGASDYLMKPFESKAIVDTAERYIGSRAA